jgi:hypothetical protein
MFHPNHDYMEWLNEYPCHGSCSFIFEYFFKNINNPLIIITAKNKYSDDYLNDLYGTIWEVDHILSRKNLEDTVFKLKISWKYGWDGIDKKDLIIINNIDEEVENYINILKNEMRKGWEKNKTWGFYGEIQKNINFYALKIIDKNKNDDYNYNNLFSKQIVSKKTKFSILQYIKNIINFYFKI